VHVSECLTSHIWMQPHINTSIVRWLFSKVVLFESKTLEGRLEMCLGLCWLVCCSVLQSCQTLAIQHYITHTYECDMMQQQAYAQCVFQGVSGRPGLYSKCVGLSSNASRPLYLTHISTNHHFHIHILGTLFQRAIGLYPRVYWPLLVRASPLNPKP